jgi:hypothetical protein
VQKDGIEKFTILLVNYKTPSLTTKCLEFLSTLREEVPFDIVLVDNDSDGECSRAFASIEGVRAVDRYIDGDEKVHLSHSRALDFGLQYVETRYVLVIHTDTFVYDASIIRHMFSKIMAENDVVGVGTISQRLRSRPSEVYRYLKNMIRYSIRRITVPLGLTNRQLKPLRDNYLKSFCCLWDAHILKSENVNFCQDDLNPGYAMQDKLESLGYKLIRLPPSKIFSYVDHIQSGTYAELGYYDESHSRVKAYKTLT